MDYHSLKRRELQALCKEHNIPANSANSVLADKLSALFNEKQKPKSRQRTCMKSLVETTVEGEPAESKRQAKKVRFSPNNDTVEYERSGEKQKDMVTQVKTRRKSMAKKVDQPVVDSSITVDLVKDAAQIPVKVTRSRAQSLVKDVVIPNNIKNKGRGETKDAGKGTDENKESEGNAGKATRSRAHTLQKGGEATESVEETVVGRARVTRSRAQTSMEVGTSRDANPDVKKKTGKQVKTEGQSVEPSVEVMDVPVRATRSRRQPLKEEVKDTVTNPQADKKRTRREMKEEDKQEPPKRKSLRTKGVDEDEGAKMEVINASRVARNSKNKANKVEVQELEEPIKHAGRKTVTRRKSVLPSVKADVDPHLEEPARRNTRRKSVVQKATVKVESPTVGKKDSKRLSGIIEDKDNATTGTPKSKKRRGTPVEDPIIETEHGSLVDKSPKSSTRSASKSEGKSVAKKEVESSLKKPVSRMNIQSSVEKASHKGKNSAIRSGVVIKESSSKKRAKLSGTKQSDSEDQVVYSGKEGTPGAKLSFKLDEEITEPEVTPAIKSERKSTRSTIKSERKEPSQSARFTRSAIKSEREGPSQSARFTRSAIKSEREGPSQSAVKEQPIAGQLFSPEGAKFRHDPAVNTAPGRVARRGLKHDGNAAGSFSEMIDKKKQTRQLALKKSLDDAQMPSPEVAEVEPDVGTIGVLAESEQPLDEGQKFSPADTEVGSHTGADTLRVQSEIKQPYDNVLCSPEVVEVQPNPDSDTVAVVSESFKEVTVDNAENVPDDAVSDVSRVHNQNVEGNVESGIFSEAENLEKSVQENLSSGNDVFVECDDVISEQKSRLDMFANQDDCSSVAKEFETASELSNANKTLDVTFSGNDIDIERVVDDNSSAQNEESLDVPVSGVDIDIERVVEDGSDVQNVESEHDKLTSNTDHATDKEDVGGDDIEPAQIESMPVAAEVFVTSHDQEPEPERSLNVAVDDLSCDTVRSDSVNTDHATDKEDVGGDDLEPAQIESMPVAAEVLVTSHDQEPEPERSLNVSVDDVSCDTVRSDSAMNEDTPKILSTSEIDDVVVRVDAPAESVVDINKDVVDDMYDMDAEGDEDIQPNESGCISYDMNIEQTKEEAETHRDDLEHETATDDDSDSGKFMEDDSHIGVQEVGSELLGNIKAHEDLAREEASSILNTGEPTVDGTESSQLVGDIGAHESLITQESSPLTYTNKESPVDGADSDLLTIKEDDRNKQEETQNQGASVDWGDYDFGTDEFENPVSANGSADEEAKGKKDDQDLDPQMSARASYTVEKNSGLAAGLADSVTKFEKDSRNAADGKSHQALDTLNQSANAVDMGEEVFDWSGADSSMKLLFEMPAATRISHARDGQEDAAKFANQDNYSSLKSLSATPATTRISRVKTGQEEAVDLTNQDHYSSLKHLFKTPAVPQISHAKDGQDLTPATTRISHVKTGQEEAVDLTNQDHYSSLKPLSKTPAVSQISHANDGQDVTPATTQISHVKTGQEEAVDLANQGHYSSLKSLFKTPGVAQHSHANDGWHAKTGQEDAVDLANQDHYSSLKSLFKTPAVNQISHAKDRLEDAADFASQDYHSSLKSLYQTPAVTQTSHVKGGQEGAADFANQDHYSFLKPLFKTTAVTQISHVKDGQDAADFANQDHYSSLKSLFKTPGVTQISHVKDRQEDAADFANQDHYSSMRSLSKTPAATQTSLVRDGQDAAAAFANQDHGSSLKSLFRTPGVTQTSQVKGRQEDAVGYGNQYSFSSLKTLFETPATTQMSHVNESQGEATNFANKDPCESGPGNEIHGVPSFEDYPHKLFEEDVGGSVDRSESDTHFGFKHIEFLNEAAGTSHQNLSGLKDNSTRGHEFEKKEDNLMKGSEVVDDLSFDTGHMHDYRGDTRYSNK
ncbi:putative transcription regulator SAP family [Helianthus debilis subsp. tardiflorus]